MHQAGIALLQAMVSDFAASGTCVVVVDGADRDFLADARSFSSLNAALAWCEGELLSWQSRHPTDE